MKYSPKFSLTLIIHSTLAFITKKMQRFTTLGCNDYSEKTEILNYSSLEHTAVNFTLWGERGNRFRHSYKTIDGLFCLANYTEWNWYPHLSFAPSSSTLIRFFTSSSWPRRSSIFTGFPTCRSSVTASREDAQMTLYSESPDCDLPILLYSPTNTTYTHTHTHTYIYMHTHLKCCWNSIYSHLLLLLYFWFANILFGFWWSFCLAPLK